MYKILEAKREEKGYKLEDIAELINTSTGNYWKKEHGLVKFSLDEAIIISKFFKSRVETLFFKE